MFAALGPFFSQSHLFQDHDWEVEGHFNRDSQGSWQTMIYIFNSEHIIIGFILCSLSRLHFLDDFLQFKQIYRKDWSNSVQYYQPLLNVRTVKPQCKQFSIKKKILFESILWLKVYMLMQKHMETVAASLIQLISDLVGKRIIIYDQNY